jgi:hypothetical protein
MSKKSRRARAKNQIGGQSTKMAQSGRPPASKSASVPKTSTLSVGTPLSIVKPSQHQYVLPELRRIGIIAGTLFVVLIVLTFILG